MTIATEIIDAVTLVQIALVNRLLSKIADQCRSVRLLNDILDVQKGDTDTYASAANGNIVVNRV